MSAKPLAELLPGQPILLWIGGPPHALPDGAVGRELLLSTADPFVVAALHLPGGSREWAVRARQDDDHSKLRRLTTGGGAVVTAICDIETVPTEGTWLQLMAWPFEAERSWDVPEMLVGVDDAVLRSIRQFAGGNRDTAQLFDWLKRQLLLPAKPAPPSPLQAPHRLVAAAAPGQELAEPEPCELYGSGLAVALAVRDGVWRVAGIRRRASPPEGRRLMLIHVGPGFGFADGSVAAGSTRRWWRNAAGSAARRPTAASSPCGVGTSSSRTGWRWDG